MRQLALALAMVVCLTVVGCGDDDDSSTTGSYPPPEATSVETPAPDDGCSDSHPRRVAAPSELDGYVILCDLEGGRSMTIENISDVVVVDARPDGQRWSRSTNVEKADEPGFAQKVSLGVASAGCNSTSCTVPPSTTLQVEADVPVRVVLEARENDTALAFLTATLESQINAKLGTPGQRRADEVLACAREGADFLGGAATWEESLRNALGAGSCATLVTQTEGVDELGHPKTEGFLARARKLAGPAFDDIVVLVAKIGPG